MAIDNGANWAPPMIVILQYMKIMQNLAISSNIYIAHCKRQHYAIHF
jgi:hypothetical protein